MIYIVIFIVVLVACVFLLGRGESRRDRQQERELQKALFTLDRDEEGKTS
ncbi:hypothetical protein KSF_054570 [Reticulibacter mediterranei]|uniref:Uncharacterized protein n=1 Tax=Reticulibacter mediterranei TaxID=2778369 RepID=A0A8J3N1R7_9CHLR|nr:hypothetical protein [Reticulibacter mediterranei]GHO95409.1 hypothetical protein KSF_054570 [Reticulibacter mediterranei]